MGQIMTSSQDMFHSAVFVFLVALVVHSTQHVLCGCVQT